jgi:polyhydroxybutyrate depolymerase
MKYFIALLLLALVACKKNDTVAPSAPPYPEGLTTQTMQVSGVTRTFLVHVPVGLTKPKAIVLALHGGGGAGVEVAQYGAHPLSVFRTVADREKFVVLYPAGLGDSQGNPAWNDCRSDNILGRSADDVGFLDALIRRVTGEYGLTNSQVFMTGGSNGALMTFRFVAERTGMVRAIATASGNLAALPYAGGCTRGATSPIPALIVHGTADPQMPPNGGCVSDFGGQCSRGTVVSQTATVSYWLGLNGLTAVAPTRTDFDLNTNDSGPVEIYKYAGANPVQHIRLINAGHTMCSRTVFVSNNAQAGAQNRDIEFAEAAWEFFSQFL